MRKNGALDTLIPQPGQSDQLHAKFHPLPGVWAQEQMSGKSARPSSTRDQSRKEPTELQRALSAERAQHEAANKMAGIIPGKPTYENPRESQNVLLPYGKSNG